MGQYLLGTCRLLVWSHIRQFEGRRDYTIEAGRQENRIREGKQHRPEHGPPVGGVQLDKTYAGKGERADTNRSQLQAALEYLWDGDVLVVHSMDRLARNIGDLLRTVETLNKCGVVVEFVKESLTFMGDDSAMSKRMLTIMGSVAEFERAMIRSRLTEVVFALPCPASV